MLEQGATSCCYAKSEKAWISDPQGVKWETFLTTGEAHYVRVRYCRLAAWHLLPVEAA